MVKIDGKPPLVILHLSSIQAHNFLIKLNSSTALRQFYRKM
jgi:hypothetical protein